MSNNPFAGRVPLNYRKAEDAERIAKSTSYRPGIVHKCEYRNPIQDPSLKRNEGNTPLRRYPNGKLDVPYVAHKIVDIVHKIENQGVVTEFERALLSLILPGQFQLVDQSIAATMAHISKDEKLLVATYTMRHFHEELNYNAGRGGGSVPDRKVTRS